MAMNVSMVHTTSKDIPLPVQTDSKTLTLSLD